MSGQQKFQHDIKTFTPHFGKEPTTTRQVGSNNNNDNHSDYNHHNGDNLNYSDAEAYRLPEHSNGGVTTFERCCVELQSRHDIISAG